MSSVLERLRAQGCNACGCRTFNTKAPGQYECAHCGGQVYSPRDATQKREDIAAFNDMQMVEHVAPLTQEGVVAGARGFRFGRNFVKGAERICVTPNDRPWAAVPLIEFFKSPIKTTKTLITGGHV